MTRRSRRAGAPFQPDLVRGQDRQAVNAAFLREVEVWQLRYRCPDCANFRADQTCVYAWPNASVMAEPFEAVSGDGVAQFCRAFEPDGA